MFYLKKFDIFKPLNIRMVNNEIEALYILTNKNFLTMSSLYHKL